MPYWLLAAIVVPLICRGRATLPRLAVPAATERPGCGRRGDGVCSPGACRARTHCDSRSPRRRRGASATAPTVSGVLSSRLLTYTASSGRCTAFHYYREARRREITASQLQASLAEARLDGLEARIDPDFLFTTLNDISILASEGQQKPVIEMLGRLSEVLRAALSDQRPEEIPLKHELTLLNGI
jgi:hypothetical protein